MKQLSRAQVVHHPTSFTVPSPRNWNERRSVVEWHTKQMMVCSYHFMSHLVWELVRVFPVEMARKTPLNRVERVLVAHGARAEELAEKPQQQVDVEN
jgi:hypothetical protein